MGETNHAQPLFNKILIANRGEIACRVIRTTRQMGIIAVAVYSEVDKEALHVQMADEAYCVGAAESQQSYLNVEAILKVAIENDVDAIHPGYGFLSENARFVQACEQAGILFIGPSATAIDLMGDKSAAKNALSDADVPLVPGYHGEDQGTERIKQEAQAIGYPVLLKAAAGGGGKGMRLVHKTQELEVALSAVRREAKASFDDDRLLVEKYLQNTRHVEVQIFADRHDNYIYLFERDCSIQRRHQKIIEEAPAPQLSDDTREALGLAAINAAKAVNYVNAGTVEFLLAEDGQFYFMEMNTRLQVEHPVTEMITGKDLVEWQILVAAGKPLPISQELLDLDGHAIEARIYAENPRNDFLPSSGQISFLQQPEENDHVRIDTGVKVGSHISSYYDPMIAKLIVWDTDRHMAIQHMQEALREFQLIGLETNIDYLKRIFSSDEFKQFKVSTDFIGKYQASFLKIDQHQRDIALGLASLYALLQNKNTLKSQQDPYSPWQQPNHWRLYGSVDNCFQWIFDGEQISVTVEENQQKYILQIDNNRYVAEASLSQQYFYLLIDGEAVKAAVRQENNETMVYMNEATYHFTRYGRNYDWDCVDDEKHLTAPMNGKVVSLYVKSGQMVHKGDTLLILEAMKMEHAIKAPYDGVVGDIYFQAGDLVEGGRELLIVSDDVSQT